jgi:hypothetical protein
MSRTALLADPAPATAEEYKDLKIERIERSGVLLAKAWKGTQSKPYAFFRFKDEARREAWITEQKQSADGRESYKEQSKRDQAESLTKMRDRLQVGTLLHYSWGYEQTQCEFFQIIDRKGDTIIMRPIAGKSVRETSWASCQMSPIPNSFEGDPITKRIRPYGLKMPHGSATICQPTDSFHCSWYG